MGVVPIVRKLLLVGLLLNWSAGSQVCQYYFLNCFHCQRFMCWYRAGQYPYWADGDYGSTAVCHTSYACVPGLCLYERAQFYSYCGNTQYFWDAYICCTPPG